jgi:fibronectin-binding autotransporter adhesin
MSHSGKLRQFLTRDPTNDTVPRVAIVPLYLGKGCGGVTMRRTTLCERSGANRPLSFRAAFAMLAIGGMVFQGAGAADLYWSGTGTWDTAATNWGSSQGGPYTGSTWSNATPDSAVFEGVAGTVTLGEAITAAGLTFDVDGYTLTANTLTLSGTATISTDSDVTATMASTLAGTVGITKDGAGTLVLTTSGGYSGGTTVNGGTLQLGDGGGAVSLGSGSVAVASGATVAYSTNSSVGVTLPLANEISGNGSLTLSTGGAALRGITLGGSQAYTQLGGGGLYNGFAIDAGTTTITASEITLSGDVGKRDSDGGTLALDTSAANGAMTLDISLGRGGVWYVPDAFTANAGTGIINVTGTGQSDTGWRLTPVTLTGDMNITASVNSGAAVTLDQTNADPGVVSGVLSGAMSLTKAGAGTLALTAHQGYTRGR